jgi:AraC family transcriptional regulator
MGFELLRRVDGEVLSYRDGDAYREHAEGHALLLVAREPRKLAWRSWLPATVWMAPAGSLRVDVDGLAERIGPGQALLTGDGAIVTAGALPTAEPPLLLGLVLPAALRASLFPRAGLLPHPLPTLSLDAAPGVVAEVLRLALRRTAGADAEDHDDADLVRAVSALGEALLRFAPLVERCPGRTAARRQDLFGRLQRARRHLEAEDGVDVPLRELAALAGLSPFHFLRVFRRVHGCTPHALATRHRVDLACRLLLRTGLPVGQVGRRIGIANPSAFAQFLRHHVGAAASHLRAAQPGGAQARAGT